jgi:phage tail sheath protein FI
MNSRVDQISRYRIPGVHIDFAAPEEVVEFKTGIPVFIGFGELTDPTDLALKHSQRKLWRRVTSWQQFIASIKKTPSNGYLRHAVRGFFENGGDYCVIVPVSWDEASKSGVDVDALIRIFADGEGVLEDIEDIDLVCVPDLMMMDNFESRARIVEVQRQILQHCKRMGDRFAILDMPLKALSPSDQAVSTEEIKQQQNNLYAAAILNEVIEYRYQISGSDGAVYFPWICVRGDDGELKSIPPCGHVAGIYARSDAKAGVFKAPANELVEGAFDLSNAFTNNQLAELNHAGVNCFRSFPSRGIRVWGARTLSVFQHDQYISIRRLFLTLVRWIKVNTRDLVFETNNASIWDRIKFRLEGYCYQLFEKGALKGQSVEEAYYVKCDQELNGSLAWDSGKVVSEIALAPIAPAEFIIIRITQSANGTVASEVSLN